MATLSLPSTCLVLLLVSQSTFTHFIPETDPETEVIDQFYFPTDQGLEEFRQLILRGLGMTRVPDLSKINITRQEYDEYHRFEPSEDDSTGTHTVILNHGNVKSSSRRRGSVEWRLRFRHQNTEDGGSEAAQLRWKPESSTPLQLHLTEDRNNILPKRWSLQVDKETSVTYPQDFEEDVSSRLNPATLKDYLKKLDKDSSAVYTLRVRCIGEDCPLLRQWRLSGQLRLKSSPKDESGSRIKRHIKSNKHHHRRNKSGTAPQPKDILVAPLKKSSGNRNNNKQHHECHTKKNGKKCCPHSLKINFRQLPGFDWILEPSEIDIFMCKGDCHYAQFSHNPANNHALFQGYLHTVNRRLVPKLCCTPSKLESVQVVHYDQDDPSKLTTTKWEGAIVKECACA